MAQNLKETFIQKLEEKYGSWDRVTSRFGTTTFGRVSSDLSISASQFSKLISGTATEGMYQRSIQNIDRLIQNESLTLELEALKAEHTQLKSQLAKGRRVSGKGDFKRYGLIIAALLIGMALMYLFMQSKKAESALLIGQHPLKSYFDQEFSANFNSPYLDITEVQSFCPCSAYEGKWSLSKPYKLPLPGTRSPGLYYLAKSADVRMKCSRSDVGSARKGSLLSGYEYLVNEIWIDTEMTPLTPRYFNQSTMTFTPAFDSIDFTGDDRFRKVATIHSFFIDQFEITDSTITRNGEPCGRFATDLDQNLADRYEIDVKFILEDVLGNLTSTHCSIMPNIYCNPNDLQEGESVIEFDCIYTIDVENLGMGGGYPYTKGYRLEQQHYSDNLLCACD